MSKGALIGVKTSTFQVQAFPSVGYHLEPWEVPVVWTLYFSPKQTKTEAREPRHVCSQYELIKPPLNSFSTSEPLLYVIRPNYGIRDLMDMPQGL